MFIVFIIILAVIIAIVMKFGRSKKIEALRQAYEQSLHKGYKRAALIAGRSYYSALRKNRTLTQYDEQAITNDLSTHELNPRLNHNYPLPIMSSTINTKKKFDVTVTFAEEDRPFVRRVVRLLKCRGITCFYDNDERIETWGVDLNGYLSEIYRDKATFCVVFISSHYVRKRWTLFEHSAAQVRSFMETNRAYILPFRLDSTPLEGLSDDIGHLSRPAYNERRLARAIIKKLKPYKAPRSNREKVQCFLFCQYKLLLALLFTGTLGGLAAADKFTPVDMLTRRLYEQSKIISGGAICNDGWRSFSQGPGTCSYHGGVDHYIDSTVYLKTIEECREEAEEVSWLPAPEDDSIATTINALKSNH